MARRTGVLLGRCLQSRDRRWLLHAACRLGQSGNLASALRRARWEQLVDPLEREGPLAELSNHRGRSELGKVLTNVVDDLPMVIRHLLDALGGSKGGADLFGPEVRFVHEAVLIDLDTDVAVFERGQFSLTS